MSPSLGARRRTRPTQRDVARLAGVSQATVSYVVTGREDLLTNATSDRVRAALRELGYAPNVLARGLLGVRTALLGVIARDLNQPSIATMISAFIAEARTKGYEVLVADTSESAPAALNLAALMKDQLCDGVVLVGDVHAEEVLWSRYSEVGLPAVGLLQGSRNLPIANVTVDNVAGAGLALDHLVGLGHEKIAFIGGGWIHGSRERLWAFREFARAHGLVENQSYAVDSTNTPQGGVIAFDRLWALKEPPTAVFAATDNIAMGVLARAHDVGVAIPRDLSVVGFDDAPQSAFLAPALTTVRQPMADLVRKALSVLVDGSRGAVTSGPTLVEVVPTLVVRASTAAPRPRRTGRERDTQGAPSKASLADDQAKPARSPRSPTVCCSPREREPKNTP